MGGGVEMFWCSICDVGMVLCCMSECGGVLRCLGAVFVMVVWFCAVCECECVCVWGGGGGGGVEVFVWFCAVCECECECVWGGGGVEMFRCSICDVGMVLCCMAECGGGVLRCLGAVFVMLVWFCAVWLSVGGGC